MTQIDEQMVPADLVCDELQPWQRLENVIKIWAAQTGFENDEDWYRKMKEYYE
jgi:hypothetical protein